MSNDLLNQGLTLMLAGMGTVFVFLTLLVVAMTLMSKLLLRFHVIELPPEPPSKLSADEIAAVSAAIAAHRRR